MEDEFTFTTHRLGAVGRNDVKGVGSVIFKRSKDTVRKYCFIVRLAALITFAPIGLLAVGRADVDVVCRVLFGL